jgi:hypothetical protein
MSIYRHPIGQTLAVFRIFLEIPVFAIETLKNGNGLGLSPRGYLVDFADDPFFTNSHFASDYFFLAVADLGLPG